MSISVTLTIEEWDGFRQQLSAVTAENARLRQEMKPEPVDATKEVLTLLAVAIPVVQFACANLPPMTVRGWPHVSLRALMDGLASSKVLDGYLSPDVATAFRKFCDEAEFWERQRAAGTEKETWATMLEEQHVTPERMVQIFGDRVKIAQQPTEATSTDK